MAEGDYSFSLTTFSPSGKLVQIEYALNCVAGGDPALGIKAKNGVVLATAKVVSTPLMDDSTFKKIENVSKEIGMVYAGIPADYRVLLRQGRKAAQGYKAIYGDEAPCSQLTRDLAYKMQEFTQSGGVRPFGVSLMVAGFDENGPQLYQVDPSGAYFGWMATAVGKNFQNAKTFLEKRYNSEDLELEDAIHTAILTLKESFEGAMTEHNIEIGVIRAEDKEFKVLSPEAVKDYLQEVE